MATTVTTGEVRLSYCNLTQPKAQPGQEPKYSVLVLIPKTDLQTKATIDAAIQEATQTAIAGKWNGTAPQVVPNPIHDGDGLKSTGDPYGDECKGHWVFNCSAKADRKPRVVDLNLQDIIDPSEIYSGMYGRVNVNFYAYNFNGKKGIGVGLNHVQKTRDGEALGGTAMSVEAAFGTPAQMNIDPITGQPR
jgi:hypothetical protein